MEAGRAVEAGRGRRLRLGRRAVFGAGALGLAVVGALLSLPSGGGDGGREGGGDGGVPRDAARRTTSAAFSGWETKPSSAEGTPRCSHGAGRLLCAVSGLVFAVDPADGDVVWRHPVKAGLRSGPPVLTGGLVQPALGQGPHLEALDPGSGAVRWQRDVPAYNGVASAGGVLLLTAANGTVTGLDSASGEPEWSRRIPGQETPYFVTFAGDPLAYAASTSADGSSTRVTAVDARTGDVRWDARLDGTLEPFGTADGAVFLLSVDATRGDAKAVVRYVPDSGATRRVPLPVPLQQAQGAVRGNVAFLMATGGSLVAVDLDAREQLWNLETGVARGSTPVIGDRYVYVTTPDGRLLAVDARRGKLAGQTRPRLGTRSDRVPAVLTEPLLAGGRVCATAPDGSVFAVNGRDPAAW